MYAIILMVIRQYEIDLVPQFRFFFFSSFMFSGRVIISRNFDSKPLLVIFLKLCVSKRY